MTRRTVLFGLIDLPFDPFLLLLIASITFVEQRATLQGDHFHTVDGVVTRSREGSTLGQIRDRVVIGLLVALVVWLLPVLARRSRRTWKGKPTERGWVRDTPWHRDVVLWLGLFMASLPAFGRAGPVETTSSSSGSGVPTIVDSVAAHSWVALAGPLLLESFLTGVVVVAVVGALRGAYRALEDPKQKQVRAD